MTIITDLVPFSREALHEEIEVLEAIYDNSLSIYDSTTIDSTIRLALSVPVHHPSDDELKVAILISIPTNYPASPPQLQLIDQFIASHHVSLCNRIVRICRISRRLQVSDALFSRVLRIYMHEFPHSDAVQFIPGQVCIYEGLQVVIRLCETFAIENEKLQDTLKVLRSGIDRFQIATPAHKPIEKHEPPPPRKQVIVARPCPPITTAQPIIDRKSVFVGHCAAIAAPEDVETVMEVLLSDKRIQKATYGPPLFAHSVSFTEIMIAGTT